MSALPSFRVVLTHGDATFTKIVSAPTAHDAARGAQAKCPFVATLATVWTLENGVEAHVDYIPGFDLAAPLAVAPKASAKPRKRAKPAHDPMPAALWRACDWLLGA